MFRYLTDFIIVLCLALAGTVYGVMFLLDWQSERVRDTYIEAYEDGVDECYRQRKRYEKDPFHECSDEESK